MSNIKYFKMSEFRCRCGDCGSTGEEMDLSFVRVLDMIRAKCGFPLVVTSGYRCPTYNDRVSSTGISGPHTTGQAVDLKVAREEAYTVLKWAFYFGLTGIGVGQKGPERFIHLDDLSWNGLRPTVWSY